MKNNGYVQVLNDIYLSSCYGIEGINDIMPKVQNPKFKTLLNEMKGDYQDTSEIISKYLEEEGIVAEEIKTNQKIQMWMVTEMKTMLNDDLSNLVSLIIDGENMGIKEVSKLLNDNKDITKEVKKIAENFIKLQEKHIEKLKTYL